MEVKKKRLTLAGPVSIRTDADRFEELQKRYFGNRVLPGSGADFIREAREARDDRLAGLG